MTVPISHQSKWLVSHASLWQHIQLPGCIVAAAVVVLGGGGGGSFWHGEMGREDCQTLGALPIQLGFPPIFCRKKSADR